MAHEEDGDEGGRGRGDIDGALLPADDATSAVVSGASTDLAVEDTLYALDGALQRRVMEPSVYLRQVRELSQQQFYARTTLLRAGAAVPPPVAAAASASGAPRPAPQPSRPSPPPPFAPHSAGNALAGQRARGSLPSYPAFP